jgi:aldose 1-epimerase
MNPFKGFGGAVGLTALLLGATALAGGALAASPNESQQTHSLSVTESPFGTMPDGRKVEMFHLKNASGMEVDVITYGGAVQSIKVPDKNGKIEDVALGFDNLDDYLHTDTYFGALIGRYGNRIAKGKFTLDGKTYSLPINNGPNTLHGGPEGLQHEGVGGLAD